MSWYTGLPDGKTGKGVNGMAQVVDAKTVQFNIARRKYPWDQWGDGQVWQLKQGEDFAVKPIQMQSTAHKYARSHGLVAHTHADGEFVYIQIVKPKKTRVKRKK